MSSYTLGFTIGPLFAAPILEVYGRRIIYCSYPLLLIVLKTITTVSHNLIVIYIFRFLVGVGSSGISVVGAGILSLAFRQLFISSFISSSD